MARMLDVLEIFLNYHGHAYLRLDGATPVQKRQVNIKSKACLHNENNAHSTRIDLCPHRIQK